MPISVSVTIFCANDSFCAGFCANSCANDKTCTSNGADSSDGEDRGDILGQKQASQGASHAMEQLMATIEVAELTSTMQKIAAKVR